MNMDWQGSNPNQDIIDLLGKLKDSGPEYPPRLWADRRSAVLAGLAAVPVATGLLAIPWIARLIKLIKAMAFIDKVILAVEVTAITGLTGYGAATAYEYRYQIQQLLLPSTIHTPFPTLSVPPSQPPAIETARAHEVSIAGTATPMRTVTPLATWTGQADYTPKAPRKTPQPSATPRPSATAQPPPATKPPPHPTKRPHPTQMPWWWWHLHPTRTPRP